MIKNFKGNILDSKANFIVQLVSCNGTMDFDVAEKLPHVEKEYLRYVRHCIKNDINPMGTVQYVPSDVWSLIMVDTLKNDNITAFDSNYQYIVNLVCEDEHQMDIEAMECALINIRDNAKKIGANVAILCDSIRQSEIFFAVNKVFAKSSVDVELWQ